MAQALVEKTPARGPKTAKNRGKTVKNDPIFWGPCRIAGTIWGQIDGAIRTQNARCSAGRDAWTFPRAERGCWSGPVVRSPVVRSPVVRSPVVRSPVVRSRCSAGRGHVSVDLGRCLFYFDIQNPAVCFRTKEGGRRAQVLKTNKKARQNELASLTAR